MHVPMSADSLDHNIILIKKSHSQELVIFFSQHYLLMQYSLSKIYNIKQLLIITALPETVL